MMHCVSDRCRQGRDPCPTPALCDAVEAGQTDPSSTELIAWNAVTLLVLVVVVVVVVAAVVYSARLIFGTP